MSHNAFQQLEDLTEMFLDYNKKDRSDYDKLLGHFLNVTNELDKFDKQYDSSNYKEVISLQEDVIETLCNMLMSHGRDLNIILNEKGDE